MRLAVSTVARLAPLGAILAVSACAGLPPTATTVTPKPPQAYDSAASLPAGDAAWPVDHWWTAYGDAQLNSLIDEALAGSPSFAAAQARARNAEALRRQAGADRLPTLSANASVDQMKQSYNYGFPVAFIPHGYNDYDRISLDATWDLDLWGKNLAALRAARFEAKAAAADAQAARLALTTSVAGAYADLAKLFDDRDAAEAALKIRKETVELTRQRLDNGLETRGSKRLSDAGEKSAAADLLAIDEEVALTRHRIAALLGKGPDRGDAITRPTAQVAGPSGLPARIGLDLVGRRPDIAAARWRAEAASQRIKQARADFYPNVNVSAFVGYQSLTLAQLTKSGSDIGSVAPALRLPIFTGGRTAAAFRGAEANYDVAAANYDQTLSAALQEVADAVTSTHTLDRRREQLQAAVAASEDAYRGARLRYEAGLSPLTTLLVSEDQLVAARHALADVNARALTLDVSLVRALGGGFRSDQP